MIKETFRDYKGSLILDTLDIKMHPEFGKNKYSFEHDGEKYYFKIGRRFDEAYREMIAEEIAGMLCIKHAFYDVATIGGKIGSLSKSFYKNDEEFLSLFMAISGKFHCIIPDELNNLEDIPLVIKTYIKDSYRADHTFNEYVYLLIYDMIIANNDRHVMNTGFVVKDGKYSLAPAFDNAEIASEIGLAHIYSIGIDHNDNIFSKREDIKPTKGDYIVKFLEQYGKQFGVVLKVFAETMTDENILRVFANVENKIGASIDLGIKKDLFMKLTSNRDSILEILKIYYEDVKVLTKNV